MIIMLSQLLFVAVVEAGAELGNYSVLVKMNRNSVLKIQLSDIFLAFLDETKVIRINFCLLPSSAPASTTATFKS